MMKGTYLVAILCAATLSVAQNVSPVTDFPTECPTNIKPRNKTMYLPHENDCTKFYSCHMGKKGKPLDCPFMDDEGNRLHFNPVLQVCDWPWNAGCQLSSIRPTSIPTRSTSSSTLPTSPSSSPTILPSNSSTSSTSPSSIPTMTISSSSSLTPPISSSNPPTTTTSSSSSSTPPTSPSSSPTTLPPNSSTPSTSPSSIPTTTISSSSSSLTPPISSSNPPPTATSSSSSSTPPTSPSSSPTTLPPNSSTSPSSIPTTMISSSSSLTPPISSSNSPTTATSSSSSSTPPTLPSSSSTTLPPNSSTPSTSSSSTPPTSPSNSPTTLPPSSSTPPTLSSNSPTMPTSSSNSLPTTSSVSSSTSSIPASSPTSNTTENTPVTSPSWTCEFDDRIHMIPHKTLCDHYYTCFNGKVSLEPKKCDRNLLFNPILRVCDYPENVNCNYTPSNIVSSTTTTVSSAISSPIAITTTSSTSSSPTQTSPLPSPSPTTTTAVSATTTQASEKPRKECPAKGSSEVARIAHHCLCNVYYECVNGYKMHQTCPTGMHFDYVREVCDWPETVNCVRPISILDILIGSCQNKCNSEGRAFPHEIDCSSYYLCSEGKKILKHCTAGLHFNVTLQICDYPEKPDCDLTAKVILPTITLATCPLSGSAEKILFPHECACERYYECVDGIQIQRKCLNGLHFDRIRKTCKQPDEANCPYVCPCPSSSEKVLLPYECKCEHYYECVKGKQVRRTCPNGQHFDSIQKTCRHADEANCATNTPKPTTTTTDTTVTPTEAPDKPRKKCPPKGSTEKARIAHPFVCNIYYECVNGIKILRTCPIGKHFDYVREVCDWSFIVKCIRPIPTNDILIDNDLDPSTCIGTCPEEDPEYAVLLPNEDCKKFCLCSNGFAWVQPCPEPLYFDSIDKVCKNKRDAICAERLFNQDRTSMLHRIVDDKNSVQPLNEENNDEQEIRDNSWSKVRIYNLDPSTCIGTCPEEDPEYAVLLPNEDCKKFCLCSNGFAWVQPCPVPLYFDSIDKVCKNKRDAVCAERSFNQDRASMLHRMVDDENLVQSLNEENNDEQEIRDNSWSKVRIYNLDPSTCIGTCPEEDPEYAVLLPNEDCKKFCLCSNGFAWVQPCPEPLYFDSIDKICKNKRDAICAERLFNQDRTSMLHRIVDDKNSVQPLNEENNDEQEIRDNSWSKVRIYNLDPSTCIGTCPEEDPEYAVLLPNEDCKKFCLCSNGFAWVQPCPVPLYFDSIDKVCKNKRDAVCAERSFNQDRASMLHRMVDDENLVQPLNEENNDEQEIRDNSWSKVRIYNLDPSTCIGTCPEEDPEYAVLLPNEDCKKFCLCSNGFAWVQPCPVPLYFDSIDKVCKNKRDAVCAERSFNQDRASMLHRMVDDENLMQPLNEENNDEQEIRDNSWSKVRIYNLDPSTCIGTCPEEDPEYAVLLPNEDCKKFCMCSNSFAWVQSCPVPLYFDSIHKVCKNKRDAVCAVRSFN